MTDHTCGDIDDKPCEWLGKKECPCGCRKDGMIHHRCTLCGDSTYDHFRNDRYEPRPACAPMLALVEAREEAARWKRAAERLASRKPMHHDQCEQIVPCPGGTMDCDACQLAWALGEKP